MILVQSIVVIGVRQIFCDICKICVVEKDKGSLSSLSTVHLYLVCWIIKQIILFNLAEYPLFLAHVAYDSVG